MPDNKIRPGESTTEGKRRIINNNKYGTNGGELNPAIVVADRPDQKPTGNGIQRVKKFIRPYGTPEEADAAFRGDRYIIERDVQDAEKLKDPDFAKETYDKLASFTTPDQRLANIEKRTDEYRGNYGSSIFPNVSIPIMTKRGLVRLPLHGGSNSNENDIASVLGRGYSRHHGYQKKLRDENVIPFSGSGTDIIDLSHDVIHPTPDSKQATILFNEYIERGPDRSIYPAKDYQSGKVEYIGRRIPVENFTFYNGIEDGHYKLDSLKNFDPNTLIFPSRSIKKGTLPIKRIGLGQLEGFPKENKKYGEVLSKNIDPYGYENDPITRQEKLDYAKKAANKIDSLLKRNNYEQAGYDIGLSRYPYTGDSGEKSGIREVNNDAKNGTVKYYDYYEPQRLIDIRKKLQNIRGNAITRINNSGSEAYYFEDVNGTQHLLSEYDIHPDLKFGFGNPNGGIFINDLTKISPPQVDSVNAYLSKTPSYPARGDLGGFDKAYLDNPSLKDYSGQYFGTDLTNPNYLTVGTVTPNRLGNEIPSNKRGGVISKLQKGKYFPLQYPDGQDGDNCPTGECAFFSNSQLRDYLGVDAYGNAWTLNGEPLYANPIPKPIDSSKNSYFKYLHNSADQFASDFDFSQLNPDEAYQVNMYYNDSPSGNKAAPTGNGTHAGYLEFKNGQGNVVHNIHGKVHVDKLKDILGGNQKSYGVLNIYRVPGFNMKDAYKQQLDDYVSRNPMGIGTEDSANVRTGLRKISPETLQNYGNNLTDEQRKRVDRRFKP